MRWHILNAKLIPIFPELSVAYSYKMRWLFFFFFFFSAELIDVGPELLKTSFSASQSPQGASLELRELAKVLTILCPA